MSIEAGIIPFIYLVSAVIIALLFAWIEKKVFIIDLVAVLGALTGLIFSTKLWTRVNYEGIAVYRFGGFPPPLGIVYVVDGVSSVLSILVSFALVLSIFFSMQIIEINTRSFYYILSFLLTTGVHGCLFTGDVFNLYVSIELTAVSSYALTAFYKNKSKAIRAAIVYGIAGSVVTSFLLLAVFMIYGAYGTLNMADIATKILNPSTQNIFSGGIYGEIVLVSKVTLVLTTWVLLFKSGIMPNHFWLPSVYEVAPLPALILFTSAADIVGVYGLLRFYHTMFNGDSLIKEFRNTMLFLLIVIGSISAIISAFMVSKQKILRRVIAYSSISQFSLALLGIAANVSEAIAGAILHLIANGLGDTIVILSASSIKHNILTNKCIKKSTSLLFYTALVIGFLNLFGVVPILPGFWSKAYLAMGFIKIEFPYGAALILISSGLCALGYMNILMKYLSIVRQTICTDYDVKIKNMTMFLVIILILVISILVLGLLLLFSNNVRNIFIEYGAKTLDNRIYIEKTLLNR